MGNSRHTLSMNIASSQSSITCSYQSLSLGKELVCVTKIKYLEYTKIGVFIFTVGLFSSDVL